MRIPATRLSNALVDGARMDAWIEYSAGGRMCRCGGAWQLRVVRVGKVRIESGQIVAGDPGMNFDMTGPFERHVSAGDYDVLVSVAVPGARPPRRSEKGPEAMVYEPRTAYLILRVGPGLPTRFELATLEHETNPILDRRPIDESQGFGVDSGYTGLLDAADLSLAQAFESSVDQWNEFRASLTARADTCQCAAMFVLETTPPCTIPICRSGWGSGAYLSYWGFDETDNPVALIVDFNLPGDELDA